MVDESPWSWLRAELYGLIARNPRSNRAVVAVAGVRPDDVVLDLGCGPGAAARGAATVARRVVGIDRSHHMIEIARRRSRAIDGIEYRVAGAEAIPFGDDEFTLVWTVHAFHHWEDQTAAIAEVHRVIRSGGRFLVVETETTGAHGLTRDAADRLAGRLEAAGFAAAAVSRHGKQLVVTATAR